MRLYELLPHLYPTTFRIEYGDELRQVFAARRAQASGAAGLVPLWLEVIKDTFLIFRAETPSYGYRNNSAPRITTATTTTFRASPGSSRPCRSRRRGRRWISSPRQLEQEYPAFGVLPARVREPERNAGVGGRKQRFRAALVIVEVAASLVLLVSSGS